LRYPPDIAFPPSGHARWGSSFQSAAELLGPGLDGHLALKVTDPQTPWVLLEEGSQVEG
jgi:hypothetical protein